MSDVNVVNQVGQVISVPEAKLKAERGLRRATDAEVSAAKAEIKYGGLGGAAAAFGAGAGRGLTFGGTDWLATQLGGEQTRQDLRGLEEANPGSSLAGELTGALAPVVLSGGAAAPEEAAAFGARGAVRAAGALPRGVAELGSLAGRGARALVGDEATSVLGRTLQKGIQHGAQGAVEGAAYGLGGHFSEDTLGDHHYNAESYLASAAEGGLLGGGLGLGIGAGGELVKGAAGKIAPAMSGFAEEQAFRATNARKAFTDRASDMGGTKAVGREILNSAGLEANDGIEQVAEKTKVAAKQAGEAVDALRTKADEAAWEGPKISEIVKPVREEILPDLAKLASTNKGAINAAEGLIADIERFGGVNSAELKLPPEPKEPEFLKEFRVRSPDEPVDALLQSKTDEIQARIEAGEKSPALTREIKQVSEYTQELAEHKAKALELRASQLTNSDARLTFQQAADFRGRLDDIIKWNTSPLSPVNEKTEVFKKFRSVMEDRLEAAYDRAAEKSGRSGPDLKAYKEAKLRYRRLKLAAQASEDSVDRANANRAISPTSYLAGLAGVASGGPFAAIKGAGAAMLHKLVLERGNATAAVLMDKASKLGILSSASSKTTADVSRSVDAFFNKTASRALDVSVPSLQMATSSKDLREKYQQTVEQLGQIAASPDTAMSHIEAVTGDMAAHAPQTADAVATATSRNVAYLQGLVPKKEQNTLMPHLHKQLPSDSEMAAFMRSVSAVRDPLGILKDFANDSLGAEAAAALKACYPKLQEKVVEETYTKLAELTAPLSYKKQSQLSRLLGIVVVASQDKDFIASVQNTYNTGGRPAGSPTVNTSQPLHVASQAQTSMQRAASQ